MPKDWWTSEQESEMGRMRGHIGQEIIRMWFQITLHFKLFLRMNVFRLFSNLRTSSSTLLLHLSVLLCSPCTSGWPQQTIGTDFIEMESDRSDKERGVKLEKINKTKCRILTTFSNEIKLMAFTSQPANQPACHSFIAYVGLHPFG